MTIGFTNIGANATPDFSTGVDRTLYTGTASWTPYTYGVMALFVASRDAGIPVPGGNNITWHRVANVVRDGEDCTMFVGDLTNAQPGFAQVSFTGSASAYCMTSYIHISGSYTGHGVTGSIVQIKTGDAGSGLSLTLNLDNAEVSANSRPIAGFLHRANENSAPRANWLEADDFAGASTNRNLQTQYRQSAMEGSASASWSSSSVNMGIVAEIRDVGDPIAGGNTFDESVTIAKVNAVTDANNMALGAAVALAATKTVSDSPAMALTGSVTLTKVDSVSASTQAALAAILNVVKTVGLTPASVALMNAELSLGRDVAISLIGDFLVVITKGYVSVLSFSASDVSVTSFKASPVGTTDFASSDTDTASFKSSRAGTTDFSQSGVETEDL